MPKKTKGVFSRNTESSRRAQDLKIRWLLSCSYCTPQPDLTQNLCVNREHVSKVPEHAFPDSLPPSFCSRSTWPPLGSLDSFPAPVSRSISALCRAGVPRCHHASSCPLKGCWRKAGWLSPTSEQLSSALGGNGGRRRSMEQSHLLTPAFRAGAQSSKDQTLHMKVHCHQLQLPSHLFQPRPLALQMGAWPLS